MRSRSLLLPTALAGAVLFLAACSGYPSPSTAPPATPVTIHAGDFFFDAPDSIPAGLVDLVMVNVGKEAHHGQLARLHDGVTFEQLQEALKKGPDAALPLVDLAGGPGVTPPGGRAETVVRLQPGDYVLLCFLPSPDGVPHVAKGMVRPLRVVASTAAPPAEPKADATILMYDFAYAGVPATVKAGNQTWKVVNQGPEPHEMAIIQLAPGKTLKDVVAWAASEKGPPPFLPVGGLQGMAANQTAWLKVDLKPGNYVLTCFIPSPAHQGEPHIALGMFAPVTAA